MLTLLSIQEEAAACRAACAGVKVGDWMHCIHHQQHWERLIEPVENRIDYILCYKPEAERALRLRLLRPAPAAMESAWAAYIAVVESAQPDYDAALKPALAAYHAAVEPARAAYIAAMESAWSTYDAAVGPARSAYIAVVASARAAYNAAVDPARAAYNAAVESARAAYNAVVASAHDETFSDCPFDGHSIFGKA